MLIDYYPRVVGQIREMREICKAEQPEFDNIATEMERLLDNMYISTSDECGIARFEDEMGIIPMFGQTLDERRITIMVRCIRKSLGYKDILNLVRKYSEEIDLVVDLDEDELGVVVGDSVDNTLGIYKSLDEIIALNVYIYFIHESTVFGRVGEMVGTAGFETYLKWEINAGRQTGAELSTAIRQEERFEYPTVIKSKDLCYLDGSEVLGGGRLLDAEIIKEDL